VGAGVEIEFALPKSSQTLTLNGSVVRHGPGGQAGIQFSRLAAEDAERLKSYVEKAVAGAAVSG
jgi:hypothetical protein